jgi:hypothetical protein
VKETEGELECLRRLEANHLTELNAVKKVEQEKVDNLNRCLGEVDAKCQKLSSEMATHSKVLSDTAKRWVDEMSALDHGLVDTFIFVFSISSCRLLAGGKDFASSR